MFALEKDNISKRWVFTNFAIFPTSLLSNDSHESVLAFAFLQRPVEDGAEFPEEQQPLRFNLGSDTLGTGVLLTQFLRLCVDWRGGGGGTDQCNTPL